jgi:hypothetical protein
VEPSNRRLLARRGQPRGAWLRRGMETGINEGYAKLDELVTDGAL